MQLLPLTQHVRDAAQKTLTMRWLRMTATLGGTPELVGCLRLPFLDFLVDLAFFDDGRKNDPSAWTSVSEYLQAPDHSARPQDSSKVACGAVGRSWISFCCCTCLVIVLWYATRSSKRARKLAGQLQFTYFGRLWCIWAWLLSSF